MPDETGLYNLLTSKDYGVNKNSALRAVKVFIENGKTLEIIDSNNRLQYLPPTENREEIKKGKIHDGDQETPPPPPPYVEKPKMFEMPLDLTGDLMGYLSYPKGKMKLEDIRMMQIQLKTAIAMLFASVGADESGKKLSDSE